MSLFARVRGRLCSILCADSPKSASTLTVEDHGYPPVAISSSSAERTQVLLRSFNTEEEGREGIVYWTGIARGRGGVVTTLVVPDASSDFGRVETSPDENAEIIGWLAEHGLTLLGQAHSHPPGAGTTHSPGDDLTTFSAFEGQVSVVVADHAAARDDFLADWGVHRFMGGSFVRIADDCRHEHLSILQPEIDRRPKPRFRDG